MSVNYMDKGFIWLGIFQALSHKEIVMDLKDLKDLAGYSVRELHEVFKVDNDGKKLQSVGYFRDMDIAFAFAGAQVDAPWHKVQKAFVLTNGTYGFLMTGQSATLLDDGLAMKDIRNAAKAKLSEAEQRVLGIL